MWYWAEWKLTNIAAMSFPEICSNQAFNKGNILHGKRIIYTANLFGLLIMVEGSQGHILSIFHNVLRPGTPRKSIRVLNILPLLNAWFEQIWGDETSFHCSCAKWGLDHWNKAKTTNIRAQKAQPLAAAVHFQKWEPKVEETVMTHCASSGVLPVWIMALLHHQTTAIHTQLCHALWNQTKKHNTITTHYTTI